MTIARVYIMHARQGHDASLETFLEGLMTEVRGLPGSEGIELLRDIGNERRFIFIEKWDSEESHAAALKGLPRETMGNLVALLDGPPDGAYFDYLKTA